MELADTARRTTSANQAAATGQTMVTAAARGIGTTRTVPIHRCQLQLQLTVLITIPV